MQIETLTKDLQTITYGYAPEHKDAVVAFYQDAFENGEILSWAIVA
jgi:hypothetical protein